MINNIFKRRLDENATQVFESALSQAKKNFSNRFSEETKDIEMRISKFEAISIFMILYAWYLKGEGSKEAKKLSQDSYDYMFDRFDISLREQGVSDIKVGVEIKKLASAFYGRLIAYGEAFEELSTAKLSEAFIRNKVCDKLKAMSLSISLIAEARKMKEQKLEAWISNLSNLKKDVYEPREFLENTENKVENV